jgi:hypothetical protein
MDTVSSEREEKIKNLTPIGPPLRLSKSITRDITNRPQIEHRRFKPRSLYVRESLMERRLKEQMYNKDNGDLVSLMIAPQVDDTKRNEHVASTSTPKKQLWQVQSIWTVVIGVTVLWVITIVARKF